MKPLLWIMNCNLLSIPFFSWCLLHHAVVPIEHIDEICLQQDSNIRTGTQMRIRPEVEEGETIELPCRFCQHPKDPVNWYAKGYPEVFQNGQVSLIEPKEVEVTADPFTFDELNRVFVDTENSLVIRNFSESDMNIYYCRLVSTGSLSGFEHDPQLILRREPLRLNVNQSLFPVSGLLLQFTYQTYLLDLLELRLHSKPWSECNACGDVEGEQEKVNDCRMTFAQPRAGIFQPDVQLLKVDYISRHMITRHAYDYMSYLYPDFVIVSGWDLKDYCRDRGPECAEKRRHYQDAADPGYNTGISCRNALYLRRWQEFGRYAGNRDFPTERLLGGVIERRSCRISCKDLAAKTGTSKNATSKSWFRKLLKFRGINLLQIFRRQKKRLKIKPWKRHHISEYVGTGIKLGCPGASLDHLVLWKNGTIDLNPFTVAADTEGRVTYVTSLILHIRDLSTYDAQVYSCWQDNTLKGEVQIKVVKRKPPPPDMRMSLLYLAVGTVADLIIFIALMVVWYRQEQQSKMKGYLYREMENNEV